MSKQLLPLWKGRQPCGCVRYAVGDRPSDSPGVTWERVEGEPEFTKCGLHGAEKEAV